jgi:hypothetical protein
MNLPEQRPEQAPARPMTHDEALDIIARASSDPRMALQLDQLREPCGQFIEDMMRDVDTELARREKKLPALLRGPADSAISLRSAAQQRQRLVGQRREMAEAMVLGTLFNMDNPDWDPVRDSARGKGQGGLLMALIKTSSAWKK